MPFVHDRRLGSNEAILILAFGRLSLLEFCSLLSNRLLRVELLCERAALATVTSPIEDTVTKLAGIHKYASPMTLVKQPKEGQIRQFLQNILEYHTEVGNFSVSEYCEASRVIFPYEDLVHALLDSLRDLGFKKVRLLRPKGNELAAEQVVLRNSLDLVAVHANAGDYLGVTSYVPDAESYRERGTRKPARSPSVSLSPRLSRTLVNIAGLSPGKTLLDPFCGSGTILAEALLQSLNCVGVDKDPDRVRQAERNLKWVQENAASRKAGTYRVQYGDSRELDRYLGGMRFDAVVSEPILLPTLTARPSTKSAHEMVKKASRVYSDALYAISGAVKSGGRIILVVPTLRTTSDVEVSIRFENLSPVGLREYHPPHMRVEYPVRLSFESTRWVRRAVYAFVKN